MQAPVSPTLPLRTVSGNILPVSLGSLVSNSYNSSENTIFNALIRKNSSESNIAVFMSIKYITCPKCGTIGSAFIIASEVDGSRVVVRRFIHNLKDVIIGADSGEGRCNALAPYKGMLVANPVKCPNKACGAVFWIIAGVVKENDNYVKPIVCIETDEDRALSLGSWPHKGIVGPRLVDVKPPYMEVYNDVNDYFDKNNEELVFVSLLSSHNSESNSSSGGNTMRKLIKID